MEKINALVEWVKNYPSWTKKDYIKAAIAVIAVVVIVGSIF
jgi:hypothetical protein|tara:strand:+ start:329 stop:451 length:123 start_codon:yes stop_codon:yes gene_type:complete